jgi:hypothetical protein
MMNTCFMWIAGGVIAILLTLTAGSQNNDTVALVLVLLPGRKGNFLFPFGQERAGAAGKATLCCFWGKKTYSALVKDLHCMFIFSQRTDIHLVFFTTCIQGLKITVARRPGPAVLGLGLVHTNIPIVR